MTVYEYPSIERALVAYLQIVLNGRNDGAHVATKRTSSSAARLVRVQRIGGTSNAPSLDAAMVTFECWDVDDVKAERLGAIVRAEVQALVNVEIAAGVWVTWLSEVGGLAYFPHPDTGLSRYQHTQQLAVTGQQ